MNDIAPRFRGNRRDGCLESIGDIVQRLLASLAPTGDLAAGGGRASIDIAHPRLHAVNLSLPLNFPQPLAATRPIQP